MTEPVEHGAATSLPCQLHTRHLPRSHMNDHHHVWPLGAGGPNTPANQIVACPTGHYNIHVLLDLLVKNKGHVSPEALLGFSFREREIAQLGFDRITRGAM